MNPLVEQFYQIKKEQGMTQAALARESGVDKVTIARWRSSNSPQLVNLEACLNVLGYELTIRKRE